MANSYDTPLIEMTVEVIERLLPWMDRLTECQQTVEDILEYTVDCDNVKNLDVSKERINEVREGQRCQDLLRAATCSDTLRRMGTDHLNFEYNPLLLVMASLEWVFEKGRRKLKRCFRCEKYFYFSSGKQNYCTRSIIGTEQTCLQYGREAGRLCPDEKEIMTTYNSKRDEYKRRIRSECCGKEEEQRFQTWRKAALPVRNAALRGEVSVEELRELLQFDRRKELIAAHEREEYEQIKRSFEAQVKV